MDRVFLFEATQTCNDGTYRAQFFTSSDKLVLTDIVLINNGAVAEIANNQTVTNQSNQNIRVPWCVLYAVMSHPGLSTSTIADPKVQLFINICMRGLMKRLQPRQTVFRKRLY